MWREKLETRKNNPIAGLYPSAKLWILVFYCCSAITLSTADINGYPVYMIGALAIPPVLSWTSGVFREFLRGFRRLCVLSAVILAAQTFLFPGSSALWSADLFGLFTVSAHESGLQKGLWLALPILGLGGMLIWFFSCTESRELVLALEKMGMSRKAGYVLLSALKMIPDLRQKLRIIMSAQEARGVETRGGLAARARAFMPSLIPLVLGAINDAGERALALEARGFTSPRPKTRFLDVKPNGNESAALALAALAAASALMWRILIWAL